VETGFGHWRLDAVLPYLPYLLIGLRTTIAVSICSIALALALGLLVALARLSRWRLFRAAAALYVDIWRSTPTLAQLLWVYYALPILTGMPMGVFLAGTLTLAGHYSAYLAEIYRSGILALPSGQRAAGLALGLTRAQTFRRIVLPQALLVTLPLVANQFVALVKESALVSLISVEELMWHAQSLAGFTMRSVEVFSVTALLYMAVTYPMTLAINRLHRHFAIVQA
jgi:polar amino acid transport system permease protein